MPFDFACFSNVRDLGSEYQIFPLLEVWNGWWHKIEMFRRNALHGRVLYLDLDVTVVGLLDDLVLFPAPFVAISDWHSGGINSSVMAWNADAYYHVHERFNFNQECRRSGDQDWIDAVVPEAARFPTEWCLSYKHDVRGGHQGPDARVIVYHGFPKPWDVEVGNLKEMKNVV